MPYEKVLMAIETFTEWGFHVVPGKTLGNQYHYFSGTDEERLEDLQHMMDDTYKSSFLRKRRLWPGKDNR